MTIEEICEYLRSLGWAPDEGLASLQKDGLRGLVQKYNMALPGECIEFLEKTGGGRFTSEVACRCIHPPPVAADSELCIMEHLLTVNSGKTSLGKVWGRAGELLGRKLIPVALGTGGDYFCISGSNGKVMYWDHEIDEEFLAAGDFLDMLRRLVRLGSAKLDVSNVKIRWNPKFRPPV